MEIWTKFGLRRICPAEFFVHILQGNKRQSEFETVISFR